jgi:hypothetical protein
MPRKPSKDKASQEMTTTGNLRGKKFPQTGSKQQCLTFQRALVIHN